MCGINGIAFSSQSSREVDEATKARRGLQPRRLRFVCATMPV